MTDETSGTVATLVDALAGHARERPDALVFSYEDRGHTFSGFDRLTNRLANRLSGCGIGKGDRIVWLGRNSDAFFIALFAAMKIGAVVVPVGWRLAPAEMAAIIADAAPALVLLGPDASAFAPLVEAHASRASVIWTEAGDGTPTLADFLNEAADSPVERRPRPEDLAIQLYTSGTTGRPKGAMLTQGSFATHLGTMARAGVSWNRWSADDVSYLSMPISHIGGAGWGIWGVFYGSHTIIERQFDIDAVFDRIERDRVTKMFLVPAAMQMMVRHPRARRTDYTSIRTMNYGASPISPALLRECIEVFGCGFTQMYGMTETIGTVVALPPEDHLDLSSPRLRSAGLPLPGVELAILDAEGNPLAAGGIGEVAIRSAARMAGYWRKPEETAKTIDADGWLHTGDAGYLDADGYLFIHDRIKDMIVTGGENVYSVEVEAVIADHPAVADVAVIGIPSERWGEEVAAFVVLRAGMAATADELDAFARTRLAGFKSPRSFRFVAELPRNPSGKVLKKVLRAPFWDDRDRQVS